eukprot:5088607-Lingulodinium_polyedra.AAC.1
MRFVAHRSSIRGGSASGADVSRRQLPQGHELNVYFPSWVHRISYDQTGRLSSVGQHRCQGHPRATALPFGPRGPKSTGSPEG